MMSYSPYLSPCRLCTFEFCNHLIVYCEKRMAACWNILLRNNGHQSATANFPHHIFLHLLQCGVYNDPRDEYCRRCKRNYDRYERDDRDCQNWRCLEVNSSSFFEHP